MFKYFDIFIFKYLFAFIVFFRIIVSNSYIFENVLIDKYEIIFDKYSFNEDDFYFYIDSINFNLKNNSILFKKNNLRYKGDFIDILVLIEEIFYDENFYLYDVCYDDRYLKIKSKNINYINSIISLNSLDIAYGNKKGLELYFSSNSVKYNEKENVIYLKDSRVGVCFFTSPFIDLRINVKNGTIWFIRMLDDVFGTKISVFNSSNAFFDFDFSFCCLYEDFFNLELKGKLKNDDKLTLNYYFIRKNNLNFNHLFHLFIDKFDNKYILNINSFLNDDINAILKKSYNNKYDAYKNKYYLNNYKSLNNINYDNFYINDLNLGFSFYEYESEKYVELHLLIFNICYHKNKIYPQSLFQHEKFFYCFNIFNIFFLEKEDDKISLKLPVLNVLKSKNIFCFSLNHKKINISIFEIKYVFNEIWPYVKKIDFNKINAYISNKIKNFDMNVISQNIESYNIVYHLVLNDYYIIIIKDLLCLWKIDVGLGNNNFEIHLKNSNEIYLDLNVNLKKFMLDASLSINRLILGFQCDYEFNKDYNINFKLMVDHSFFNKDNKKNCYSLGIDMGIEMWIISINKNSLSWSVSLKANADKIKKMKHSIEKISNNLKNIVRNVENLAKIDD